MQVVDETLGSDIVFPMAWFLWSEERDVAVFNGCELLVPCLASWLCGRDEDAERGGAVVTWKPI